MHCTMEEDTCRDNDINNSEDNSETQSTHNRRSYVITRKASIASTSSISNLTRDNILRTGSNASSTGTCAAYEGKT